jgi:hypothetical protein
MRKIVACTIAVFLLHIGLTLYDLSDVRTCEIEHTCVGSSLAPVESVIGFPVFFLMGLVPDKFDSTDMLLPLVLLNSFLAATLVAFVVVVVIRVMKKA